MSTFSTKAYLQKKWTNKEGLAPVYIRYNFAGKSSALSTGLKANPKQFDDKNGIPKSSHPGASELKNQIRNTQTLLEDAANSLEKEGIQPVFAAVKAEYERRVNSENELEEVREYARAQVKEYVETRAEKVQRLIIELEAKLQALYKERDLLAGTGTVQMDTTEAIKYKDLLQKFPDKFVHSSDRTKQNMAVFSRVLLEFHEKNSMPFSFKAIDMDFYAKYIKWLAAPAPKGRGYMNNNIGTHTKRLRMFIGWAEEQGLEINPAYKKFKVLKEEKLIVYLNQQELNLLWDYRKDVEEGKATYTEDGEEKTLNPDFVKYIHICAFQNLTGLRYSDLKKSDWIIADGILQGKTKKTKGQYLIPVDLDKRIMEILSRYNFNLAIAAEQNYNAHIKTILKALFQKHNINQEKIKVVNYKLAEEKVSYKYKWELMSTHSNRRGFCTRMYQQGYSELHILKMIGSKTNTELRKYINNDISHIVQTIKNKQAAA